MTVQPERTVSGTPRLVRSLTLPHAVLYGLGVTIGAGIYVLVGIPAARSGMHAPLAVVGAGVVMAFSTHCQTAVIQDIAPNVLSGLCPSFIFW
jgi:basic amino acid/polyamine antiporter, APA family